MSKLLQQECKEDLIRYIHWIRSTAYKIFLYYNLNKGKEGASNEHTISQNFMANTNDHSLAKMYKQTRKLTLSRFGELRANSTSTLIFFQLHTALRVLMHWDSMIFSFCLRGERKRSGAGVWGGEEKGHPLKSDHQVKSSTRKLKRWECFPEKVKMKDSIEERWLYAHLTGLYKVNVWVHRNETFCCICFYSHPLRVSS